MTGFQFPKALNAQSGVGGIRRRGAFVPLAAHHLACFLAWLDPFEPLLRHPFEAVKQCPGPADVFSLLREPLYFLRRRSRVPVHAHHPLSCSGAPALRT